MADISNEELRKEITAILKDADLTTMSAKKVRQQVEEKLDVDLTDRMKEVDDLVMECVQEKQDGKGKDSSKKKKKKEKNDVEEEKEEDEEEEEEEEKPKSKRGGGGAKKPPAKKAKKANTEESVEGSDERLKGSMSGDMRDFNNIETRAVIKFFFLQGKAPKEIHAIMTETLGEYSPSYATVKNWVAQFKRGDFSTCDAHRPGRPKTVTTPEIIDEVHELILEDRRISAKSIAEKLGISRERVGSIIHEDLDRKLCGHYVE